MQNHKAGFVNIVGNPNVGKSTLMNSFVGEKLSIITSKAQTTRHRILGIVNDDDYQIIFSDTPGIIAPAYELQNSMMNFVKSAFEDADILIYMVEIGEKRLKDEAFFDKIKNLKVPLLLILNKVDTSNQDMLENQVQYWKEKLPNAEIYPMSALLKFNTQQIFNRIIELLPEAQPYYDKDVLTDRPERFFVNETIREKILLFFKKEVPYSVEIVTDEFEELNHIVKIRCTIITERETQRAILLGHKGESIKKIGIASRKDLQVFFDKKVHLELYVKVIKNWRKNARYLNQFGYKD